MKKAIDTSHRVIALPERLREAVRRARENSGQTNLAFVAEAVAEQLPGLLQSLRALGFGGVGGKRRPARLPFSTEAGTWQTLRDASEEIQVPAVQLLMLCLSAAAAQTPPRKKRGRRAKRAVD
jgi:hypothetical protein